MVEEITWLQKRNSILLTVPKECDVPTGIEVEAKLVENEILYEFVKPKKRVFFDFSEDILADILSEGYSKHEILEEFRNRKNVLTSAFRSIAEETVPAYRRTNDTLEETIIHFF